MSMTEVSDRFEINEDDPQLLQFYKQVMKSIFEIDDKLDVGTEAAGKRKITNDLVSTYEEDWQPVVDALIQQMDQMALDRLAGALNGIVRNLNKKYQEAVDVYITTQVEAQPKNETPEVSDEEKKELSETRSQLAKQAKTIVDMAISFNLCTEDEPWELPARRGAQGKRGKRALTFFTWAIDDVAVDEDNDSVKGVAALLGYEKAADFTQALRDAGIDTKAPGAEINLELKGKAVHGHAVTAEEDDAAEEEEVA
jgi:hypothetical protein